MAMMIGILIVCFIFPKPNHLCHFGFKRTLKSSIVYNSQPRSIAVGDLNNDQQIDIAVVNSGTNTIGIFLSTGNGTFANQQTYLTDTESRPSSMVVSHFNDDNYLDIAVANYAINNIEIFLGNGDGTFIKYRNLSTGSSHPLFIAVGDFNNDNQTDIAVANYGTNSVGILLAYGDGSFQDQTTYSTDYDSIPRSLAVGHFNSDNHSDIAVANYGTSNIGIFLGYGNGSFRSQQIYTTLRNSNPSSIVVGDFDNDNQLDVAVSNNDTGNVGIFFGHGDGTFETQIIYPIDSNSHPQYITVGDLNGDNELDLVITDSINDRVYILCGYGNGSFATVTTYDGISESDPVSVAVADFNNNNQTDIAVANYGTNNVLVLMDYRTKQSTRQTNYYIGQKEIIIVAVSDFNNDHIPDIVCSSIDKIFIFNGLDNRAFDKKSITTINVPIGTGHCFCVGDINNDHWMDIVTANIYDNSVGVLLGIGNGTFGSLTTYSTGDSSVPYWVALGDMNNDGRLDIISVNYNSKNIGILFGNGDGTIASIMTYSTGNDISPTSAAIGDINNDNCLDIVVVGEGGYVDVFLGDNSGTLTSVVGYPANPILESIVLADLNNDGNLDIAFTSPLDFAIFVLLGYENGTFVLSRFYRIDNNSKSYGLIVADFNNDNISDLAATVYNNNEVVIFYGYGNGSFVLGRTYSTGFSSTPYGIAVADFDNNKQLEIVVALYGIGDIAVLTDYVAADFVGQVVCSTGATSQQYSVAVGDFNHDNRSDVVVANSGTNGLSVLLGSGNGTFGVKMVYPIGNDSQPQYVITCDINKDQQLDIVSVNSKLNSITVMMGQIDGTFANGTTYSTGNDSHPYAVASSDLNNDTYLDLVIANEGTDSIGVFFGFNYNTFQSPVTYSSDDSLYPMGIAVSDFNNDGFQDIAAAFSGSGKIGIFLGYGNGTFILTRTYPIGDNAQPYALAADDFNSDTQVDIVVCDRESHNIGILLGHGDGSFVIAYMCSSGGSLPWSVAVGDLNKDHQLDIVVANMWSDNVGVLLGYGNGTFSTVALYSTGQGSMPASVTLGDLNNDYQLDIVVANYGACTVGILFGYGNGTFQDQGIFAMDDGVAPTWVAVRDFNNDSSVDIVIVLSDADCITIALGNGNGTFGDMILYLISGSKPYSLDVGDFNSDKMLDIVVVNFGSNNIVVLFGYGDGTFLSGEEYSTGIGSGPMKLAIGDFNNDTRLDIAVTNFYANNIGVFLGGDSEPFATVITCSTGSGSHPHSVAVGDFNNDLQTDIVVANYGTDNVGVLLASIQQNLLSMKTYSTGTGTGSAPYSIAVADFNNDTYLDVVVTNSEADNIIILLGYGNGTFFIGEIYPTGSGSRPYTVVISDFNNDKILDLAIANSGTSNIFLLYGHENGTFGNDTSYSLGYGYLPYSIAVTDLNNDGWMDIVVACYGTDHIETWIQMC